MEKEQSLVFSSPIGPVRVWAGVNGVSHVSLMGLKDTAADAKSDGWGGGESEDGEAGDPAIRQHLEAAKNWIVEYLTTENELPVPELDIGGTDFQRSVWREISKLKRGETATYGEIATRIGNPTAVRAVGSAVGANPVPLLIGCHRVLGQNARITGYSGGDGLETKRLLLEHEGIEYRD